MVGPIAVGNGPRGLAVTRDGACVYVANLLQQHAVGDPDVTPGNDEIERLQSRLERERRARRTAAGRQGGARSLLLRRRNLNAQPLLRP